MVDKYNEHALAEHLAPRIRTAIKESRRTLEDVGEQIGVSKPAVSKWTKKGQITLSNLWRLSVVTGKPMAWFFPGYNDSEAAAYQESVALKDLVSEMAEEGDAGALEDALLEVLKARRRAKR